MWRSADHRMQTVPHATTQLRVWLLFSLAIAVALGLTLTVTGVLPLEATTGLPPEIDAPLTLPNVAFEKDSNTPEIPPGGTLTYTLIVTGPIEPTPGLIVYDTIPPEVGFILPESLVFSTGNAVVDPAVGWLEWWLDLLPEEVAMLSFRVQFHPEPVLCGQIFENRAEVIYFETGDLLAEAFAITHFVCPDLGDAPDSDSNHWNAQNTLVWNAGLGHYPTVWGGTLPGSPAGPLHAFAAPVHLGDFVSFEHEADIGPDMDGINNILDKGLDLADLDRADDGWLNPGVPLYDCQRATLRVRVTRQPGIQSGRMFLNVWFDGTRDGDWNDVRACTSVDLMAHEWIVQNFIIDTSVFVGSKDFIVPTVLVLNDTPIDPTWVRLTLSEQPAVKPPSGSLPDGRGPNPPQRFELGETEDYIQHGIQEGDPGTIEIIKAITTKMGQLPSGGGINVSEIFTYSIVLHHQGGTGPVFTVMSDTLPAAVHLVDGPRVVELTPHATPLTAAYIATLGPSGTVLWAGHLSPNAMIRIDFQMRMRHCPNQRLITNRAVVRQPDGALTEATIDFAPECEPPTPAIEVQKRISIPGEVGPTEVISTVVLPGQTIAYVLHISTTSPITHHVNISDALPAGMIAVGAHGDSGIAQIIDGGKTVVWEGLLGPHNTPVDVWIKAKLTDQVVCERALINKAFWWTRWSHGESNETLLRLRCWDLGDAPDSTNHYGVAMTAYPAAAPVNARYPTVFGVQAPERGPAHRKPRPLHLGPRVSYEQEADVGWDMDGVHNIEPATDKPDQDRWDDGIDLTKVSFQHCQYARIPIIVSIDPGVVAQLGQTQGQAYLNLWLDSDRDGDWADNYDCPGVGGVVEHIVIDHPVNVAALGPGLHIVYVTTNKPVWWPISEEDTPAWMRVTLSDRKSNKTLGLNSYGDGRGYGIPFILGETEDYFYQSPTVTGPADPGVRKVGQLIQEINPASGAHQWVLNWVVQYNNAGLGDALNTRIVDTFGAQQILLSQYQNPYLPHVSQGQTLTYTVGVLPAGTSGFINLRMAAPLGLGPGAVVTNTVTLLSSNDANPTNNTAVATATIPLLPPLILFPRSGTHCTGTFTVTGRAQTGLLVDLHINGVMTATLTPDSQGRWSYPLSLPDGDYEIFAIARMPAGPHSPLTPPIKVIVDSSLGWSPISLRFIDQYGQVTFPRDHNGRTDATGWNVFLSGSTTYTASVGLCCQDPNAEVTLEIPAVGTVNLLDPDNDRIFEGVFTTPSAIPVSGKIRLCVVCNLVKHCSDGEVLIDPEGTVFDLIQGTALPEATVTCYAAQDTQDAGTSWLDTSLFSVWNAADYGQVNPQTTAADGYFSFFTPPGTYRIEVNKDGFQRYRSWDLVVSDEPVHHDAPLTPDLGETADFTVTINAGGFDPPVLKVAPGDIIAWVNTGERWHTTTSLTPTVAYAGMRALGPASSDGWASGLLAPGEIYMRRVDAPGTYTYVDHETPTSLGHVLVQYRIFLPIVMRGK